MGFKILEDVALADIAFRAEGRTKEEMFASAAKAVFSVMTKDKINPVLKQKIKLKSDKIDTLLYDWLAELIYLKDVESSVFTDFDVKIEESDNEYSLSAEARGDKIDYKKYTFLTDVKAITMNMFEVKKEGSKWICTALLDV